MSTALPKELGGKEGWVWTLRDGCWDGGRCHDSGLARHDSARRRAEGGKGKVKIEGKGKIKRHGHNLRKDEIQKGLRVSKEGVRRRNRSSVEAESLLGKIIS